MGIFAGILSKETGSKIFSTFIVAEEEGATFNVVDDILEMLICKG